MPRRRVRRPPEPTSPEVLAANILDALGEPDFFIRAGAELELPERIPRPNAAAMLFRARYADGKVRLFGVCGATREQGPTEIRQFGFVEGLPSPRAIEFVAVVLYPVSRVPVVLDPPVSA